MKKLDTSWKNARCSVMRTITLGSSAKSQKNMYSQH